MIRPMRLWRCLVAALLLVIAARAPAQMPAHPLGGEDVSAWLDGFMPYALQSGDIAGASVVVVRGDQVIAARGYGWADVAARRPVDPQRTLFRVGSLTKLFTWTAVMQQVEAGRLDLDRDVNAYLDFRIPPFRGQPITLRHLLTHTPGFELAGKDTITNGPPIALGTYLKRWTPARIYLPGTTPAYSNWGAALAGYIVERVSGEPYDRYVERHLLAPLGMRGSSLAQPLPSALAPWMASSYARASAPPRPFEVIGPVPAGALSASGGDMARFMIAHLANGRGILSPATTALMQRGAPERLARGATIPPLNRMALGFVGMTVNGHPAIGHGGDTQLFHSLLVLFPRDGVGLFASFSSAGRDGAGSAARDALFHAFADRYFPAAPITTRVDPATAATHARMMVGQWQDTRFGATTFLAVATLLGQTSIALTPDGGLLIAALKDAGGASERWDEVAPFVWQSRDGHQRLAARVVDGRVVRWSTDASAPTGVYDRVPWTRSAAWLLPALGAGVIVLLLTVLYWPASALARRRHRAPAPLGGTALHLRRATRVVSLLDLVVLGGWIALFTAMFSDLTLISTRSNGWLRLLQLLGAVVFVGAVGIAGCNAWLTWRARRSWTRKVWSLLILVATTIVLYAAASFGLLVQGTDY